MDPKEILDEVYSTLLELPDSTGLLRCIYFTELFQKLKRLKDVIEEKEEQSKNEKLQLEAEILDLKEKLKGIMEKE